MSQTQNFQSSDPVPAKAGVGLKAEHIVEILENRPSVGWFEVHAENYMGEGGPPHHFLTEIRKNYPLSVHGVGLSIGANGPLDKEHLAALKKVCDRYQPGLVSEHLAWSTHDGIYLNDLLPVPYNAEALDQVADHIDEVQEVLGRHMLLENPSTYLAFDNSEMSEIEFLTGIVRRTGCGLLFDVNNVHVSATNHNFDAAGYIDAFPIDHVGEIHLGGYTADEGDDGEPLLIDAHGSAVSDPVWDLYARAIARCGPKPTLIEWDSDVPAWNVLYSEARRADAVVAAQASDHAVLV